MSARSRVVASAVTVLVAAAPAAAQQRPAERFVRALPVAAESSASPLVAADSVARYAHAARVQRATGASLVVAGLGAVAAAYVQLARGGRQGMNGAQGATFAAGTVVGVVGATRWSASRASQATAARWDAIRAETARRE